MLKPWLIAETTPDGGAGGDGGGADDGRPDWLPENFKSPEDLAKSYDESRREMDRLRSQLDDERQQFASALERMESVTAQTQQQQDPQTNQLLTAYQNAVEAGDASAMLSIQLAINQQATAQILDEKFKALEPRMGEQAQADRDISFQIAQDRVAKQFGDRWGEISGDVDAWLHEHASWLPTTNSPDAFENVIREGALSVVNAKAAKDLAAIEADRAAKLSAQTAEGSGSGRFPIATDEKQAAWAAVKGADLSSYSDLMSGRKSG